MRKIIFMLILSNGLSCQNKINKNLQWRLLWGRSKIEWKGLKDAFSPFHSILKKNFRFFLPPCTLSYAAPWKEKLCINEAWGPVTRINFFEFKGWFNFLAG